MPAITHEPARSWWLDRPILTKGAAMIAVPILCLLGQLVWLAHLHRAERAATAITLHSEQVQLQASHLLSALVDAETGVRGFALTGDPNFLSPFQSASAEVPATLERLRELVADNPEQSARVQKIENLAHKKMEIAAAIVDGRKVSRGTDGEKLTELIGSGKRVMDEARAQIAGFQQQEQKLLERRSEIMRAEWARTTAVLWSGAALGLFGGMVALWAFSRGISGRLHHLSERTEIFSAGKLPEHMEHACDEIGQLGAQLYHAYEIALERGKKLQISEAELRSRNLALESANAELEAFSYSVSHDLRAPLRHIDGFSRILSEDYSAQLPQEGQRILERIRAGTAQMGNLIDELLQLGRLGRTELNLQVTGLEALALEARAALEPEAAGREIEWRIAKLPFAACDAGLMRQVFTNLFSNAVKYTRPRPKAVIEVGETRMPEGTAIFVRDNGVGFSMKYADKLFGVFQRLHRSQDFEGTGVGLAAVARIIRRHGGRIWAEAELDRGATFYFTLSSEEGQVPPASDEINSGAVTVFANGARYEARS